MRRSINVISILICTNAITQPLLQLEDAINIALKNSYDIKLQKNNVAANTVLNNYGVAGGLPTINATAGDNQQITSINQKFSDASRNTQRNNAGSNGLNAGVTGSFLLYNGMRVVATKNRLEKLQSQSEKLWNAQIQNTIAAVMTTYYDIVRQQSYQKTIDISIEVAKQRLIIVQTQQSVGLANNQDLFQSQLDLNALLQIHQSQQIVIAQAKTELLRLLTTKADSVINIADTILVDKSVKYDEIINNLYKNAEIMAAEDQVRINKQVVKETAALRYPSIRFNAGYNYNRSQNSAGFSLLNQSYGPTFGLSLSIPIYSGSAFKRQQKAAEIDVANAELQKKTLVRDYTAAAVKTYQAYQITLLQLEAEQNNYNIAQQLLDLVLQKYQLKVATILDVRAAQQSFEDAGYRLVNLNYSAKAAEIELKRLANQLNF
jgi:outer membrane protein TolC